MLYAKHILRLSVYINSLKTNPMIETQTNVEDELFLTSRQDAQRYQDTLVHNFW